ncbi:MAG: delta(1)-pyrroline-2-carboxylate reductase family protein [Chloroflexota bacterium]|nr:delta(1)-pyrroline-2-carboxylate reductase family protein [Chloroflexota bacterium]
MLYLDAEQTRLLLPYPALADSLHAVLVDRQAGKAHAPVRTSMPLPGGSVDAVLLLMPAHDERLAITKLVTVHPGNTERGLPVVQGDVLVMNAATGERLAMLDGTMVTARRTAALSLLAARLLAPEPRGTLLVVGSGTQARSHMEALREGLGVEQVYITSRNLMHAEALARHGLELGLDARAVSTPGEVLSQVSLIVTATTSTMPVLPPDVRDDAFIAAVGAYTPTMAELPSELLLRSRLFADTLEGAQAEAGDFIQAGVDWSKVTPLAQALDMERPESGPIIFKSVGHALWDLAAARLAVGAL